MTQVKDDNSVHIPGIPVALNWQGQPRTCRLSGEGVLSITSMGSADWFIDPEGSYTTHTASALLFPVKAPCQLKAQVTLDGSATFDAGALVVYHSEQVWAKLALERSPQGQLTIISVVTDGISDDCNSGNVTGDSIYLRVSKSARAYTFHYSLDNNIWHLVRYFALEKKPTVRIGFLVQSPMGEGCTAHYGKIRYVQEPLADAHSGV